MRRFRRLRLSGQGGYAITKDSLQSATVHSVELAAGLFALGGVALGGILNELRAWRDTRARRAADLFQLRRETYARAMRDLESVSNRLGRWIDAPSQSWEVEKPVWDALEVANATLDEVRLISNHPDLSRVMAEVLETFRRAVAEREGAFPNVSEHRRTLVCSFDETWVSPNVPHNQRKMPARIKELCGSKAPRAQPRYAVCQRECQPGRCLADGPEPSACRPCNHNVTWDETTRGSLRTGRAYRFAGCSKRWTLKT